MATLDLTQRLKGRDFLRVLDWSPGELLQAIDLGDELKRLLERREEHRLLPGRALGMIFEKHSTRTRVSFEVGITQLGGFGVFLSKSDIHLARGESIRDTALVLSRYVDAIMIRTFEQADVEELARHASVPVINGLTDAAHPCQALADLMTIRERLGGLAGVRIGYFGDGNNVCASLMVAAASFGLHVTVATPAGYEPVENALAAARERAATTGGSVEVVRDPREAAAGADVLYTDVWTSMGQEDERPQRLLDLAGYGIDEEKVALGNRDAIVMHCLPAHFGEEIAESVLYGPRSAVWDEAENRLHAQKALMALVIP